jgi:hypothetical protein
MEAPDTAAQSLPIRLAIESVDPEYDTKRGGQKVQFTATA